jgi:hypothetical protein
MSFEFENFVLDTNLDFEARGQAGSPDDLT